MNEGTALIERPHGIDTLTQVGGEHVGGEHGRMLGLLLHEANRTYTDALVILRGVDVMGAWFTGRGNRVLPAMSVTKSLAGLAVGRLVESGVLESYDVPLSSFFQEWAEPTRRPITVRHVLTHTSGILSRPTTEDIYESGDFVQHALQLPAVSAPGERFEYNNAVTNLLSEVVHLASGVPLSEYVQAEVFDRAGVDQVTWDCDPAGTPVAMAGLQIHPVDLAKVGHYLLSRLNAGAPPFGPDYWRTAIHSVPQSPFPHGLLWWLVEDRNPEVSTGFFARGYRGQSLVVLPGPGVVGVRMSAYRSGLPSQSQSMDSFPQLLAELFR